MAHAPRWFDWLAAYALVTALWAVGILLLPLTLTGLLLARLARH
jgi:hypothetical protein